ncbi:MAG: hypothetical protein JST42_03045, partial [Bacteroidetes bacterium]|nr:hypothetical protein [Bacteroidota bacterium]
MLSQRPAIWQMIKQAVEANGGKASYSDVKRFIVEHWGVVNENTINAQLITLSVNQPSRVHYANNKKP